MKIGLRILLGYFVIVAIAALLLGKVFLQQVKPGVRQAMEDTLVDTANLLAAQARDDLLAGRIADGAFASNVRELTDRDIGAEIWGFSKRKLSTRIYVTDAQGIVVFDSDGRDVGKDYSRWNDVYLTLRGRYGARSSRADPNDEDSSVMHVAAPIVIRDGMVREAGRSRIIGVLTVAKPNQTIAPFIAQSQAVILRWGGVLLGAALLIGLVAAWWLSRQLGALRRYADAVTAGERATLPDSAGEFGDLGRALETMRAKLEGKQYVEQYVHALTHELKSPLAAIRGSAELLDGEPGATPMPEADRARFVATIRAQSGRMAEMIDKLLALASVEHRQRIEQPQRLALREVVGDAAERVATRFDQRGLRLEIVEDGPPVTVSGDAFLLRQSIVNLLENAADFAPAGSAVVMRVARDGDDALLEVRDCGPGVPDYALDRVFERFYSLARPEGASRSSGLGLCFVAEAMELHDGRASLANHAEGGAVAVLRLPLA
ncbi:two-component system sensor histidine kinase CreC [Lysobacter brunescens]|uniref:histidine kinase n=1 Tax=Lysobacter brunescens TaxID=262323 RepID=A0ABW2YBZ4_9GAMM